MESLLDHRKASRIAAVLFTSEIQHVEIVTVLDRLPFRVSLGVWVAPLSKGGPSGHHLLLHVLLVRRKRLTVERVSKDI